MADVYDCPDHLTRRIDILTRRLSRGGTFGFDCLSPDLFEGRRVINVGCGIGSHDLAYLQRHSVRPTRYVIVDKSPAMVQVAQAVLHDRIEALESRVVDCESLSPDEVGEFDTIICMHILYHTTDPRRALSTLRKILSSEGNVLITTVVRGNNEPLHSLHREVLLQRFGASSPEPMTNRFDSTNMLAVVGSVFAEMQVFYSPGILELTSADEVMAYYTTLPCFLIAAAAGISKSPLESAMRHRIEELIGCDGRFLIRKDAISIIARGPWESHSGEFGRRLYVQDVPSPGGENAPIRRL